MASSTMPDPVAVSRGAWLSGDMELGLMVLAFGLVCVAAYSALRAAERVTERRWRERWLWRGIGAVSLGGGIWSMHFIGLLAYRLPLEIRFEILPTLLSLLVALLTGLLAMQRVGEYRMRKHRLLPAALLVGTGLMMVLGINLYSMQVEAEKYFDRELLLLSGVIATATAYMAMRMMLYLQRYRDTVGHEPILVGALLVGAGALAMHVFALSSLRLSIAQGVTTTNEPYDDIALALTVGVLGIGMAGLVLLGTYIGRQSDRRMRRVASQIGKAQDLEPITGLPREATAKEQLSRLALRITRPAMIALFLVDCDRAQRAAILLGESGREASLLLLGRRLTSMRGSERDIFAVLHDFRFVVISKVQSPMHAAQRAGFIAELCSAPLDLKGHTMRLSARVGYSIWPDDGDTYQDLLAAAELALRDAHGNNLQTEGYSPELRVVSERRLEIEQSLAAALDASALSVVYQPIVSGPHRKLAGFEALVRWHHPSLGDVSPDEFIGVAEDLGMSAEIDRFVLRRAIADFATLPPLVRQPLRIGVNCAAATLMQPKVQAEIEAILGASGISPHRLTLEMTEVSWATGGVEILAGLEAMAAAGIGLAIDDFGTGHSSLARLQRVAASTLKIDREFIQNLGTERGDSLVRSIIELGQRLGMQIVAEGVETVEQEHTLLAMGCELLQGYFYGRPVPWQQLDVVVASASVDPRGHP